MRQRGKAEKKKREDKIRLEERKPQCKSAKVVTGFTSPLPPSSDQNGLAAVSTLQEKEVHSYLCLFFCFCRCLSISRIYAKISELQFQPLFPSQWIPVGAEMVEMDW